MTQNQIAYWNLQEQKRANQVKEGISSRETTIKEKLLPEQLAELKARSAKQLSEKSLNEVKELTEGAKVITEPIKAATGLAGLLIGI